MVEQIMFFSGSAATGQDFNINIAAMQHACDHMSVIPATRTRDTGITTSHMQICSPSVVPIVPATHRGAGYPANAQQNLLACAPSVLNT